MLQTEKVAYVHSKLIDLRYMDDSIAIVVHYVQVRLYTSEKKQKKKIRR